jgi:hypothetical protein
MILQTDFVSVVILLSFKQSTDNSFKHKDKPSVRVRVSIADATGDLLGNIKDK